VHLDGILKEFKGMQDIQYGGDQQDEPAAAKKEMQQVPEEKAEYAIDQDDHDKDGDHPEKLADIDHG
jgi:hypothetical protein